MRHRTVNKVIKTSKNRKAQRLHDEWQTCVWQAQVASEENGSHNLGAQRSISEKSGSVQKGGGVTKSSSPEWQIGGGLLQYGLSSLCISQYKLVFNDRKRKEGEAAEQCAVPMNHTGYDVFKETLRLRAVRDERI